MSDLKTVAFDAEQIMEQAQVFASAWSLVGGCFDSGSMLAEAESAKAELRTMIEKTLAAAPTPAAQSAGQEAVAWAWEQWEEFRDCAPYWNAYFGMPWWPNWESGAQPVDIKIRNLRPLFDRAAPVNGGERACSDREWWLHASPACQPVGDGGERAADAPQVEFSHDTVRAEFDGYMQARYPGIDAKEAAFDVFALRSAFFHARGIDRLFSAKVGGDERRAHDAWFNDYDRAFGPLSHSAATYTLAAWMGRAALSADGGEPDRTKPGNCHKCGLPKVNNPHPDAGKPDRYLDVGCPTECLPCTVGSRHACAQQAMTDRKDAERYQFLRNELHTAHIRDALREGMHELDEAIDAAIAAKAKGDAS